MQAFLDNDNRWSIIIINGNNQSAVPVANNVSCFQLSINYQNNHDQWSMIIYVNNKNDDINQLSMIINYQW